MLSMLQNCTKLLALFIRLTHQYPLFPLRILILTLNHWLFHPHLHIFPTWSPHNRKPFFLIVHSHQFVFVENSFAIFIKVACRDFQHLSFHSDIACAQDAWTWHRAWHRQAQNFFGITKLWATSCLLIVFIFLTYVKKVINLLLAWHPALEAWIMVLLVVMFTEGAFTSSFFRFGDF